MADLIRGRKGQDGKKAELYFVGKKAERQKKGTFGKQKKRQRGEKG